MNWSMVTAIAVTITAIPILWKGLYRLYSWFRGDIRYNRLSSYDRDVLKSLHENEMTLMSCTYDDENPPRMYTMLDFIPGAPVACRLVVSKYYQESLKSLAEHGLLQEDTPWRYDLSQKYVKAYRLTLDGKQFICKYHTGLHRVERFIRRWFKGLNKHKCNGCFSDKVGDDARRKLPNALQGNVWPKKYYRGAKRLGEDDLMMPVIYEYPPRAREDRVECMVEIPLRDLDVDENDRVFMIVHDDDGSNRPRHLHTDTKLAGRIGGYPIEAMVISIQESDGPVGTVLNLGHTRPFDPAIEIERQSNEV